MAATVSTAGPYYSTGSISFSSLRSNFRAQRRKESSAGIATFVDDTDEISASQLRRLTITSGTSEYAPNAGVGTDPNVPTATENAGISTYLNWKTSQFRNSIKYYYITQSGTNLNFDIDAQSWNSNLDKNVRKILFVDGTCGSNDATLPAATFNATAYNFTIDNYGSILGASGKGGGTTGADPIDGQKGGDALQFVSTNGSNNVILVRTGSKIYGGGGGGEKGKTGTSGSNGTCYQSQVFGTGCQGGSNSCPGGWNQIGSWNNCCSWARGCSGNNWYKNCARSYTISGGTGGSGGNGGPGRGYNWQEPNSLSGATAPAVPSVSTCPSPYSNSPAPTSGKQGENGASGGEWATNGGSVDASGTNLVTRTGGSGGGSGRAVFGSDYTMSGPFTNANIVKGTYG